MAKSLKWLFGILFTFFLLAVALLGFITTSLDPNDYREDISQKVKDETQLELNIANIEWSLFPWLGLNLGATAINSPTDGKLASFEQIIVKVKLFPLLQKKIEVGEIQLVGSNIHLVKKQDGSLNWDIQSQTTAAEESPSDSSKPFDLDLTIGRINIKNAKLTYHDLASGSELTLNSLNFLAKSVTINNKSPGTQFPIELSFTYNDNQGVTLSPNLKTVTKLDLVNNIYQLEQLVIDTKVTLPEFTSPLHTTLKANLTLNLNEQQAQIDPLEISIDQFSSLSGSIQIEQLQNTPLLSGNLKLNETSIRPLAQRFGLNLPATTSDQALKSIRANLAFKGDPNKISIKPLEIYLDQTTITGEVAVNDLSKQAIYAKLNADQFHLDDYLSPTTEDDSPTSTEASDPNAQLLPVDTLRALNLNASITLNKMVSNGLDFNNVLVTITSNDGVLTIDPMQASLLDGQMKASATVDVRGKQPKLSIKKDIEQLQIEPALKAFANSDLLAGLIFFGGDLQTSGNSIQLWKQNLTGNSQFKLSEGLLHGVNLTKLAFEQLGALGPALQNYLQAENLVTLPPAFAKDSSIHQLLATIQFKQGIASSDQMQLNLNEGSAAGSMAFNMNDNSLEFSLQLKLAESISNPYIAQIAWPITCRGSITATPSCKIDSRRVKQTFEDLAKQAAEDSAKQALSKKLQEKTGVNLSSDQLESAAKIELKSTAEAKKADLESSLNDKKDEALKKLDDQLKNKLKGLF